MHPMMKRSSAHDFVSDPNWGAIKHKKVKYFWLARLKGFEITEEGYPIYWVLNLIVIKGLNSPCHTDTGTGQRISILWAWVSQASSRQSAARASQAYVSRGHQIKLLYGFDPSRDTDGTLQLGPYRGAYGSRGHQLKLLYGFVPREIWRWCDFDPQEM